MTYYYDETGVYPTRIDAIKHGKNPKFYYHDDFFSKVNWSTEPSESLEELYRQRAQQIRDNYQHVVICYSGGVDSTQVLETFYYNNIHIDEILVVGAFSQDKEKGSDDNHNGDIYHNVFPTLDGMNLPNTKITIADYTDKFRAPNQFSLIEKFGPEFYKHIGVRTSVHNLFWYDIDKFIGINKRTAYVMGKDKPLLKYHAPSKRYFTLFHDISYVDYGNKYQYENGDRVSFYSDPDASAIMVKQCHLIKQNAKITLREGKDLYDVYTNQITPIIYNLRNPLNHHSQKSKLVYLSARDMFMLNNKDSEMFNIYKQGIHKLSNEIDLSKKYIFESKPYFID